MIAAAGDGTWQETEPIRELCDGSPTRRPVGRSEFPQRPTETEEQRRAFDELLEQREGQAWSKSLEGRRAAPLAAAAAASACADVAQTLELRVFHLNNAAPRQA
jgi:hypothetical protein